MLSSATKSETLERLRGAMGVGDLIGARRAGAKSTGFSSLDRALPGGGIHRGSLLEILDPGAGGGAMSFAAAVTRAVCSPQSALVVLDAERRFFPPAAASWGMTSDRLIVVHPNNEAEALWAAVQSLRCRAVGAVWLRRERLTPHDFRRLALAAEEGETLGVLFRPVAVRGQPTWAEVQLLIESRPSQCGRRLRVEVTRCRGGAGGGAVEIELDDATGGDAEAKPHEAFRMSAISPLADSTAASGAARIAHPSPAVAPARFAAR